MRRQRLTTTIIGILLGGCALLTNAETFVFARTPATLTGEHWPATDSAEQRAAAAIRCGQERSRSTATQLAESLADDSTLVQQAAAWALSQLGEAAEPAIQQLTEA